MDPALLLGHLDPTNNFAMGGLNMAFARQLLLEGKPLPKILFINVMVEKNSDFNRTYQKSPFRSFFNCKHWQKHSHCQNV